MNNGLQWWQHQLAWLNDRARFRLCLKARQCGMSTVVAAEAVRDAVDGKTTILASASERQSRELMRRCLKILPIVTAASHGAIAIEKESAELVELSTGGRVLSVPASAATVQGFAGSVVLDEAAWMPDADLLWQALAPSITASSEHRLSVLSTPRGKGGLFYRLWHASDRARWSHHKITIDDALAGGCQINRDDLRAGISDESMWRACYLCEFIDEQYALLPFDLLQARTDPALAYHLNVATLPAKADLYCGFDVGRKHDLSVLVVLERLPDKAGYRWLGAVELRREPFDRQKALLVDVLKRPGLRRLAIDASGLGLQLSEELTREHGSRVEPVTMTAPIKESLASLTLSAFQKGEITIPDHLPLRDDLHSLQREITVAGNVRYVAPRDAGSHADRWTALALALHAAAKPVVPFQIVGLDKYAGWGKRRKDGMPVNWRERLGVGIW